MAILGITLLSCSCSSSKGIEGKWYYGYDVLMQDDRPELYGFTGTQSVFVFTNDGKFAVSGENGEQNGTWEEVPTTDSGKAKYEAKIGLSTDYLYIDSHSPSELYLDDETGYDVVRTVWVRDKNAVNQIKEKVYKRAMSQIKNEEYDLALEDLESISDYKDSAELYDDVQNQKKYKEAQQALDEKSYDEAIDLFEELDGYKDSADRLLQAKYEQAGDCLNRSDYSSAIEIYQSLGDYKDSSEQVTQTKYRFAEYQLNNKHFEDAIQRFTELGEYKDSVERVKQAKYQWAENYYNNSYFGQALEILDDLGAYDGSEQLREKIEMAKESEAYKAEKDRQYQKALNEVKEYGLIDYLLLLANDEAYDMDKAEKLRIQRVASFIGEWTFESGDIHTLSHCVYGDDSHAISSFSVKPVIMITDAVKKTEELMAKASFDESEYIYFGSRTNGDYQLEGYSNSVRCSAKITDDILEVTIKYDGYSTDDSASKINGLTAVYKKQ